jgi:hypothetical protein
MEKKSKNILERRGIFYLLILLSIGILGSIFFFPINFNNQYTCLYHRIFAPEHHNYEVMGTDDLVLSVKKNYENEEIHSELIKKYIVPFGFVWWSSLAIIVFAFFLLNKERQKKTEP